MCRFSIFVICTEQIHFSLSIFFFADRSIFRDVPMFECHGRHPEEAIKSSVYLHLPTPVMSAGGSINLAEKKEIESCIDQCKRGWDTTADRSYHIDISDMVRLPDLHGAFNLWSFYVEPIHCCCCEHSALIQGSPTSENLEIYLGSM